MIRSDVPARPRAPTDTDRTPGLQLLGVKEARRGGATTAAINSALRAAYIAKFGGDGDLPLYIALGALADEVVIRPRSVQEQGAFWRVLKRWRSRDLTDGRELAAERAVAAINPPGQPRRCGFCGLEFPSLYKTGDGSPTDLRHVAPCREAMLDAIDRDWTPRWRVEEAAAWLMAGVSETTAAEWDATGCAYYVVLNNLWTRLTPAAVVAQIPGPVSFWTDWDKAFEDALMARDRKE